MLNVIRDTEGWSLHGTNGMLRDGALTAQVDIGHPPTGLHRLQLNRVALDGYLLSVSPGSAMNWPAEVGDAYVRGHDLVATYKPAGDWPYAPQIYWTAGAGETGGNVLAAVSLLVSIQTNLLDTHPLVDIGSRLSAEAVLRVSSTEDDGVQTELLPEGEQAFAPAAATSCVLWRLADRPISYAEIVSASDFRRLTINCRPGGLCETRWQLFADFLEKGVIRRARIHAAFLPRENDVRLAADWCRAVERRPLPLTT
jgi:surface antigen